VHVGRIGCHRNSVWDYVTMIGNHNAPGTRSCKCNFCEVEHIGVAIRIKAHLGGLRGHDIVSCPNILETMFVLFSPRLPRVASMGNYGMSTTSTNVGQNSRLQANNVPFEPS
jgi:hypothetical protein